MSEYIKADSLVKYYIQKRVVKKDGKSEGKQTIKAVDGVSFTLDKGEILGVIGESGCGKSTLGRILMRLEDPTSGDVYVDGASTAQLLKQDRLAFRKKFQIVFQNPFDTFDPRYTIRKILLSATKLHKIGETEEEQLDICKKMGYFASENY